MEPGGCPFGGQSEYETWALPTLISSHSSIDKEVMATLVPGTQPQHFIRSPLALPLS